MDPEVVEQLRFARRIVTPRCDTALGLGLWLGLGSGRGVLLLGWLGLGLRLGVFLLGLGLGLPEGGSVYLKLMLKRKEIRVSWSGTHTYEHKLMIRVDARYLRLWFRSSFH